MHGASRAAGQSRFSCNFSATNITLFKIKINLPNSKNMEKKKKKKKRAGMEKVWNKIFYHNNVKIMSWESAWQSILIMYRILQFYSSPLLYNVFRLFPLAWKQSGLCRRYQTAFWSVSNCIRIEIGHGTTWTWTCSLNKSQLGYPSAICWTMNKWFCGHHSQYLCYFAL